jgi:hypothetical protein
MKKTAPLAFRIPNDLKNELTQIAKVEARSVSQVCEILLKVGVDAYKRDGASYIQKFLSKSR